MGPGIGNGINPIPKTRSRYPLAKDAAPIPNAEIELIIKPL